MLDTGATSVGIPQDIATRIGAREIGKAKVHYGDGSTGVEPIVLIKKLTVGDVYLTNIEASVGPVGSPLLLGKNFLDRFS